MKCISEAAFLISSGPNLCVQRMFQLAYSDQGEMQFKVFWIKNLLESRFSFNTLMCPQMCKGVWRSYCLTHCEANTLRVLWCLLG